MATYAICEPTTPCRWDNEIESASVEGAITEAFRLARETPGDWNVYEEGQCSELTLTAFNVEDETDALTVTAELLPMEPETGPAHFDDLDALFEAVKDGRQELHEDLPNFGGPTPDDTMGVWSWDETRLLVATCGDDAEVVNRAEWANATEAVYRG